MSISSALNNAISGLTVTSRMAEAVSSNLSNALTEGYGKRSVELSSVQTGNVGGGVQIAGITRHSDPGLLADRRLADAELGNRQTAVNSLTRLEQAVGAVDDPNNLVAKLAAFETALISAASDPASDTRLATVVDRLSDLADTLNNNSRSIQKQRQEADAAIASDVERLNGSLQQIEKLNADILRIGSSGQDVSALVDARQVAVDSISGIVPIRQINRENGTIGLMTTSGVTLLDTQAVELGFTPTPIITADMTYASDALGGVTIDGSALDNDGGARRLGGGSLGAAFALRDETLVDLQQSLDDVAVDIVSRFQDPATDPTLTTGTLGLLTDGGSVFDPADTMGLAGRVSVNPSVVTASGGDPSLLRDGMNAATPRASGDAVQLNRWLDALGETRADVVGSASRTAAGRIAEFTSLMGSMRVQAEEQLSFSAARWDTLTQAELANGVDTDIELQTLMRVEQAYAANAKVLEAADFMMQRLMEI
ncbi:flagellar hook-associated protein FlgK [Loktanella sp. S4079]|uniref:flagellar hook-associated protein FlgK n=1 Tax=Loktanella sp. S4079 TaxID=579483 RepID=UPI0005FA1F80|nr:flagellar hook-associated protein FlgK [Loktanella sp. S4079]KJZ21165.1 flagellar hook protein FlgK [Loktanella sp. S4079]